MAFLKYWCVQNSCQSYPVWLCDVNYVCVQLALLPSALSISLLLIFAWRPLVKKFLNAWLVGGSDGGANWTLVPTVSLALRKLSHLWVNPEEARLWHFVFDVLCIFVTVNSIRPYMFFTMWSTFVICSSLCTFTRWRTWQPLTLNSTCCMLPVLLVWTVPVLSRSTRSWRVVRDRDTCWLQFGHNGFALSVLAYELCSLCYWFSHYCNGVRWA